MPEKSTYIPNIKRFFRYMTPLVTTKKTLPRVTISTTLALSKIGLDFLFALMVTELFSAMNAKEDPEIGGKSVPPITMALLIGLVWYVSNLTNQLKDIVILPASTYAGNEFAEVYISKVMHSPYIIYQNVPESERITNFYRARYSTPGLITQAITSLFPTTVNTVVTSSVLSAKYGSAGIGLLPFIVTYVGFTSFMTKFIAKRREIAIQKGNEAFENMDNVFKNRETIEAFNKTDIELLRLHDSLMEGVRTDINAGMLINYTGAVQGLITAASFVSLLMYYAYNVTNKENSPDDFILIFTYLSQFFNSATALGQGMNTLVTGVKDFQTVLEDITRHDKVVDTYKDTPLIVNHESAKIKFNNVSFSYKPNEPVINGISFTVKPGSKVCFVGPSGSGKSTLLKLLFRFYDIEGGNIYINKQDISKVSLTSLHNSIGIISQTPVILPGSLKHNLLYGCMMREEPVTDKELKKILKAVNLEELIPKLNAPEIGELSGGQKQRVAIARVLLKKPMIIITDEATSALDAVSEKMVQSVMDKTFKGCTTFVITHRLDCTVDADEIFTMKDGKIVEHGNHHELIMKGGIYKDLWDKQKNENSEVQPPILKGEKKHKKKKKSDWPFLFSEKKAEITVTNFNGKDEVTDEPVKGKKPPHK